MRQSWGPVIWIGNVIRGLLRLEKLNRHMSARQLSPVKSSPEVSRVSSICSEEKTSASTRVSPARILYVVPTWCRNYLLTGILPQKKFYCPNLIFWIAMGCGTVVKLVLVGRAKKTPKIENFSVKACSLAPRGPIAGCLEVSCAGHLEVPGNKLWDRNFQF